MEPHPTGPHATDPETALDLVHIATTSEYPLPMGEDSSLPSRSASRLSQYGFREPYFVADSTTPTIVPRGVLREADYDFIITKPYSTTMLLLDVVALIAFIAVLVNMCFTGTDDMTALIITIAFFIAVTIGLVTALWLTRRTTTIFYHSTRTVCVVSRRLLLPIQCADVILQRTAFEDITDAGFTCGVGLKGSFYIDTQLAGRIELYHCTFHIAAQLFAEVETWQRYVFVLQMTIAR